MCVCVRVFLGQVCNGVPDCPDVPRPGGPSDEQGCRSWGVWGPWSPCSHSCGAGSMIRHRHCPLGGVLGYCRGEDSERQQCFKDSCPGEGAVGNSFTLLCVLADFTDVLYVPVLMPPRANNKSDLPLKKNGHKFCYTAFI